MYCENPHAKRVVDQTAQLWLHIPISFETVRVEDLKLMTTGVQPYVTPVTWKSTKANRSPRLNVLRRGKKHTAKLLAGFLKTSTLP
jgi:hypothetical protein